MFRAFLRNMIIAIMMIGSAMVWILSVMLGGLYTWSFTGSVIFGFGVAFALMIVGIAGMATYFDSSPDGLERLTKKWIPDK